MTDWIQTFSGRKFHSMAPRPEEVFIEDIAHSLSLLCRFNGHCKRYYSVADHSVRVSRILPAELRLWGLLHDAGEAYLTDLPRPVKKGLPQFSEIEDRVLEQVALRFGLSWPMPRAVKDADNLLLATEARDLMAPPAGDWKLGVDPLPERIEPLGPEEAERLFLQEFHALRAQAHEQR
jgi:5'-deoxynucleotidase YfbR-like HD superfamily hydrolase